MAWSRGTSRRKAELPKDWAERRRLVKARDKVCVFCGSKGTDVDHIERGGNHSLANLRLLCRSCHMKRTGRDGGSANRGPKRTHRPAGKHPGLIDPSA